MTLYTIGFTQKKAEEFFGALRENEIQLLVDIRLNNKSQLAGFTKNGDLQFFLKEICGTEYIHCEEFAPSKELLSNYQAKKVSWDEYTITFHDIMEKRGAYKKFVGRFQQYDRICLLCSEATPEHCHRRLLAELIANTNPAIEIRHL